MVAPIGFELTMVTYFFGCIVGFFGIMYRENRVNRDFEQPEKLERPIKKSRAGFQGSLMLREFQFLPLEAWAVYINAYTLESFITAILVFASVFGWVAWILTKDESRRWDALIEQERPLSGVY